MNKHTVFLLTTSLSFLLTACDMTPVPWKNDTAAALNIMSDVQPFKCFEIRIYRTDKKLNPWPGGREFLKMEPVLVISNKEDVDVFLKKMRGAIVPYEVRIRWYSPPHFSKETFYIQFINEARNKYCYLLCNLSIAREPPFASYMRSDEGSNSVSYNYYLYEALLPLSTSKKTETADLSTKGTESTKTENGFSNPFIEKKTDKNVRSPLSAVNPANPVNPVKRAVGNLRVFVPSCDNKKK